MDVERAERVEAELDTYIARADEQRRQTEGERTREQLWVESVRCYHARQQQDHRAAWYEYEMRLYRIHSGLASEHLARAERLENSHHHEEASA